MSSISYFVDTAIARREGLIARLTAGGTDCYRLLHGTQEGVPGLTVDRYGDLALAQAFHKPLAEAERDETAESVHRHFPKLDFVYNDRTSRGSRVCNRLDAAPTALAERERIANERGVRFRIRARHRGNDPWLFLDLRPTRRAVVAEADGKTLLNLFAYTCGVGVAAAVAGATRVVNVDFARSSLAVGDANAALNGVDDVCVTVLSDVFPALRQFAGIRQPPVVRGRKLPSFPHLERERFDIVFLDPPPRATGPFGVVDLVRDYQSLLKPAFGAVADGGVLYCTNNVARVDEDEWHRILRACARKHGRDVRALDVIRPGDDFPSIDDQPPLKVARLEL